MVSNSAILFLVAYWRGPEEAGVYALAVKYTTLVLGFAMLGLDSLFVRDVAQKPQQARNYTVNLSILRLALAVLAYGCLGLFVSTLPDYAPHTERVVLLYGLSLVPESLFRLYQSALITLHGYEAVARLGVFRAALALPLGVAALWLGASLETVVLLQAGVTGLSVLATLVPLRSRLAFTSSIHGTAGVQRPSIRQLKRWLRATFSFAVIDGLYTLEWQIDVILLSFFVDEEQVGLYGVAQAILSILMLGLYSVDAVMFPQISRVVLRGRAAAKTAYVQLVAVISAASIPAAIALALALTFAIPRILGDEFRPVLVPLYWLIIAWTIHFLNAPGARLIIALGRQKYVAGLVTLGVAINIATSLLLIPSLGIQGPAVARVVSAATYGISASGIVFWVLNRGWVEPRVS
jgi:O-antigen/teichoic acid export membrane protein